MKPNAPESTSYFDTTLGAVHFNLGAIDLPDVEDKLADAWGRRAHSLEARSEYQTLLMAWLGARHYPLLAHEWAHALQAISYPALYLRCLRELSAICGVVDALRKVSGAVPPRMALPGSWMPDLAWPTQPLRLTVGEDGSADVEDPDSGWPRANDLSEADLLEDSASIFQYKAEIGGEGSAELYRRWLREEYRYSKTFAFLARVLPAADAYVALPCLVAAANMTVWPPHTFVSLVGLTVRAAPQPPSEMGSDAYLDFLEHVLRHELELLEAPDPRASIDGNRPNALIGRDCMMRLAREFELHPLSAIVELAWEDAETTRRLRDALLRPAEAFDRRVRMPADWLAPFAPPVAAFRLGEEVRIGETVLAISPTLLSRAVPAPDMSWPEYLVELMRMKAFVFATTTPFFDDLPHTCPHLACGYHRHGMCRRWPHIPKQPRECNFPEWLRESARRRFDFDSAMLVRVDEGTV